MGGKDINTFRNALKSSCNTVILSPVVQSPIKLFLDQWKFELLLIYRYFMIHAFSFVFQQPLPNVQTS